MSNQTLKNKYTERKKTTSTNLKRLMQQKQITRKQLAEATGCKYSTVAAWVKGTNSPRDKRLQALADYFKVPTESITGKTKKTTKSNTIAHKNTAISKPKKTTKRHTKEPQQTTLFKPEKRTQRLLIRLKPSEKAMLARQADSEGYATLSGFMRQKMIAYCHQHK